MISTLRDALTRFFGSDEVELTYITPNSPSAPAPQAEAQAVTLPAEAPTGHEGVVARRGAAPLALRPASQAE